MDLTPYKIKVGKFDIIVIDDSIVCQLADMLFISVDKLRKEGLMCFDDDSLKTLPFPTDCRYFCSKKYYDHMGDHLAIFINICEIMDKDKPYSIFGYYLTKTKINEIEQLLGATSAFEALHKDLVWWERYKPFSNCSTIKQAEEKTNGNISFVCIGGYLSQQYSLAARLKLAAVA